MLVTLLFQDKLYSIRLPEKVKGQYWIEDLISIEAQNNKWCITGTKHLKLFRADNGEKLDQIILENNEIYPVRLGKDKVKGGYILTEPFTEDRCSYQKYIFEQNGAITIGSAQENSICVHNAFVTAKHARLEHQGGTWVIYDNNSTNGSYINGRKVSHGEPLHAGDVVFILGFKIIVGEDFFSINNPDGCVEITDAGLQLYNKPEYEEYEPDFIDQDFYYRAPKFDEKEERFSIKIEGPTSKEREDQTPIILTMAPALLMGVASFASGLVTTSTAMSKGGNLLSTLPTLLMSVSMLCGMVLFPFIMKKREKRQKRERERNRQNKYLHYLNVVREEIQKNINAQKIVLEKKYPFILERIAQKDFFSGKMWAVTCKSNEFLQLRVGIGDKQFDADIVYPENRFSIEEDILRNELEMLQKEEKVIRQVPITLSLLDHPICGIVGKIQDTEGLLHSILLQILSLYGYDEVKLIFIGEPQDLDDLSYLRYVPHIWDDHKETRFLATTVEEVKELSGVLYNLVRNNTGKRTHYIIVSTSKKLSERLGIMEEIIQGIEENNFYVINFFEKPQELPSECNCILEVDETMGYLYSKDAGNMGGINLRIDSVIEEKARSAVQKIAQYELDLNHGKYKLPGMLTFLQMFDVGKYEHLNILSRWQENNPVLSLQTPVGVDTSGGVFNLDLHEKVHGPHGLVAGMTGSGKSEFIITFILSMAVNFHPHEVAFILIDYKGGGLAGAFEHEEYRLPHLAGTITNLDGTSIARSMVSIQSELRRRQSIFNYARALVNEGTMDIYKYQKLYREGVVKEEMPHLFIISDEFAELKAQQPEFMDQLISTARIGRSLGVHLILATQKPSGVVNEQIWANSKFKVCLKVQDKADSNDMLKRPDAAELTETGRFYLQVGYNELFEMGQSAWCGAPYTGEKESIQNADASIEIVDNLGKVFEKVNNGKRQAQNGQQIKQIVAILQHISQVAKEEGVKARSLWLPPLENVIDSNQLFEKYSYKGDGGYVLNPVVGELDDPYNQRQDILTVPLSEKGNTIVYGAAGSGKNIFLTTMLYSLYRCHDAKELNTYILDFGTEALQCFAQAPQTGNVILNGEDEKVDNLVGLLRKEIAIRKKVLSEYAGDYQSYCKQEKEPLPNILVIINNFTNFVESYEIYEEELISMTRECSKYGIYFVITVNNSGAVRYRMQQNFNQIFVLQLNEKTDYFNLLGNTGGLFPSKIKGRGLILRDALYEFQTAYPMGETDNMITVIKEFCKNLSGTYEGEAAKKIPVLKNIYTTQDVLCNDVSLANVPYGIGIQDLEVQYMNLKNRNVYQILAKDSKALTPFAQGMAEIISKQCGAETIVFDEKHTFMQDDAKQYKLLSEKLEDELDRIYDITVERHNAHKRAGGQVFDGAQPTIVILFVNLEEWKEDLDDDRKDKLVNMLLHMKSDFGMMALTFDQERYASRSYVSGWRKEHCHGDGIYIGNDLGNQYVLNVSAQSKGNVAKTNKNGSSAFYVEDGNVKQVKLLVTPNIKEEISHEENLN